MPLNYDAIRAQLVIDIRSVIGASAPVVFGSPRREIIEFPHAVVLTSVARGPGQLGGGPRKRRELYTFDIELRLAIPDPYPEDGHEAYTIGVASELAALIDPFGAIMPTRTPYASVASSSYVTLVEPQEAEDEQDFVAVRIVAEISAYVNS